MGGGEARFVWFDGQQGDEGGEVKEHEGRGVGRRDEEEGYPDGERDGGEDDHEAGEEDGARDEATAAVVEEVRACEWAAAFVDDLTTGNDLCILARFDGAKHGQ